jgi:hypothetical protein
MAVGACSAMKVVIKSILALWFCLLCIPVFAVGNKILRAVPYVPPVPIPPTVSCPMGTSLPDGCPGANSASTFQVANAFTPGGRINSVAGTSTNYTTTNIGAAGGVNAAGIHYPVGAYTAIGSTLDPAVSPPTGCTSATGPYGNPRLTCTGPTFTGVTGYNLGAVGGHGCTSLYVNPTGVTASKITITDNYVTNDGNCGFGAFSEYMVNAGSYSFETDFTFNTFQGNGTLFPLNTCNSTALDGGVTCNGAAALNTEGIVKIEYNAFLNFSARPIYCNMTAGQLTDISFMYNYVEGWDYHPYNGHTEFIVCNPSGSTAVDIGVHVRYNTIVQTTNAMQFGPSPLWLASSYPVDYSNGLDIIGNTIIGSFVGGAAYTATTSGCVGGTSACTTPGTNFYVSTTTANIGTGEELGGSQGGPQCVTPSGTATVSSITAPSGGLSTMTVTGTPTVALEVGGSFTLPAYGANTMTIKSITTGIGAAGTYVINNTNTGSYTGPGTATISPWTVFAWINSNIAGGQGNGSSWTLDSSSLPPALHLEGPATCTNLSMWAVSSNTYVWQGNNVRSSSAITIQGNYIDGSSSWVPRDGTSAWVIFTMGGASGQTWTCANPSTVNGNVDMAGIASTGQLNPDFSGASFSLGCGSGGGTLTTPAIKPFVSSNFNPNQTVGLTGNSLTPNAGTWGAIEFPSPPTKSAAFYFEMVTNPSLGYGNGIESVFSNMNVNVNSAAGQNAGQPNFFFNRQWNGSQPGSWWWLNPGSGLSTAGSAVPGTGYANGVYPFTAPQPTPPCIRPPSGVWWGGNTLIEQTDPGFGCPTGTMSLTATQIAASIPNTAAQQTATSVTCTSGGAGILVSASVPVSPGLSEGLQYGVNITGTGGTSLSPATLTATSVTGSGPYTVVGTIAGTCPTGLAGTIMNGTGASINFPVVSTTFPYPYKDGSIGIATHNNQHICGWIVEEGDDSNTPGFQSIEMVDDKGNPLTGSPSLVPYPNQGVAAFNGSAAGAILSVSTMKSYAVSNAVYSSTTGFVTFTAPTVGFVEGTEFTVSGVSPSAFNQTYIAVAGTSSTQVVGSPLSGPAGISQPFTLSPGTFTAPGSLVTVITPGQTVAGLSAYVIVLPYGSNGTTGTATSQAGQTFALSGAVTTLGLGPLYSYSSFYYSETTAGVPVPRTQAQIGDFISSLGGGFGGSMGNFATLWGVIPSQVGGAPAVADLASICTKQTDIQTYALAKGLKVNSLYRLDRPGIWEDSGDATVNGYITNTSGTNATLNVISTIFGSLAVTPSQPTAYLTGPGLPVVTPVTIPLNATASPTYAITPPNNTMAGVGSVGSPVTFAVGKFVPATPNAASTWKGWIDTACLPYCLHVTSFDNGGTHAGYGSFTGSYNPLTGVLTASAPFIGSIPAPGIVQGSSITGQPLMITQFTGGSGPYTYNTGANYYQTITSDTTMWATSSSVVPGGYVFNPLITNPVKVLKYSGACGIAGAYNGLLGCYTLSGSPNASNAVGSLSSQQVFTANTITDGGAIAPGPALTMDDKGPGIVYPVNLSTGLGALTLSGKYNVAALGGTPSGIQVLVSNSANGPPLAGCTPCNWGALTGTISGGVWKGTLAGIPAGGPEFVTVRPANGTAYQVPSQSIRMGAAYPGWGNGQFQAMFGGSQGPNATSWFSGLQGTVATGSSFGGGNEAYLTGPPVGTDFVPAQSNNGAGDRFAVAANGNTYAEPVLAFDQGVTNGFGVPASLFYAARDGVGMGIYALGNTPQTQTIGIGDGSSTVWCSSAIFCTDPTGGVQAPLTFNAASLTGVSFAGSTSGTSTLTVTTRYSGALEPGMVLGATGSPTVLYCKTGCTTPLSIDGSTWQLSAATTATGTLAAPLRADPPSSLIPFGGTTTPFPNLNIQTNGSAVASFGGFGQPVIKAGTTQFLVNGVSVCQDSTIFSYNLTGGNCTGTGIAAWENYINGNYKITFSTPPASGAVITASYTNIISPEATSAGNFRPQNLDEMGDGTTQSGFVSSRFSKFPSGVSGQIWSSQGTDFPNPCLNFASPFHAGYPYGAPGCSQMMSWLFGVKFPALIPGSSASVPFLTTPTFRLERPGSMTGDLKDNLTSHWAQDVATSSAFPGTIASSVLTETANVVGAPPWEGMVVSCSGCPPGMFITGLTSGTWGASGSTYSLANASGVAISSATPMKNAVSYPGPGPAQFLGALYDTQSYDGTHPDSGGFASGRRATSRWTAMLYEQAAGGSDPQVDRVKAHDGDCDAAALAAPCFVVASSHNANASAATWSPTGNLVTVPGGLAPHARPFVAGMNTFCSGCNSGLIITSVSAPGQAQVGATFTFTVQNVAGQPIGGSGAGLFAGGVAGTSGVGSNAIDIPISINVVGLTSPALDTCGVNINGAASGHVVPTGKCAGGQIGDLVRGFRIGTVQQMNGDGNTGPAAGSVFDDGLDPANGTFNQSGAFTCNIIAASLVQCIKAPLYTGGVFAGVGQWPSGSTYLSYGDEIIVASRVGTLVGNVGGQGFPFTGGSGYTNGTTQPTVTCSGGGTPPKIDVTVAGGAIVNVAPSATSGAMGANLVSGCSVALPAGGTGGAIPGINLSPVVGIGGIATYNWDNNAVGAAFIYDNSCSGPLAQFFNEGLGCFEPGLPVRESGQWQGLGVSG